MMSTKLLPVTGLAMVLLLAGCSGGPSSSDVKGAVEEEMDRANENVVAMAGQKMADQLGKYELTDFELLGCEPTGESYTCDVVVSMTTPMIPINAKALTLRVRDSDRGWVVMGGAEAIMLGAVR